MQIKGAKCQKLANFSLLSPRLLSLFFFFFFLLLPSPLLSPFPLLFSPPPFRASAPSSQHLWRPNEDISVTLLNHKHSCQTPASYESQVSETSVFFTPPLLDEKQQINK